MEKEHRSAPVAMLPLLERTQKCPGSIEIRNGNDRRDGSSDKELDELVKIASAICDTPISLLSIVDDERQ